MMHAYNLYIICTQVYELDARQHLRAARPTDCMYCDECVVQADIIKMDTPEDDPVVTVTASTDRLVYMLLDKHCITFMHSW
jgi:hypothetical protein